MQRDTNDIFRMPILKFIFKNRQFLFVLKLFVALLFFYAVVRGFIYTTFEQNSYTTMLFWTLFWPFFVVVTLSTFGRLFCGICPHGFLGKYITRFGIQKKMPKALDNPFIGVVLLVVGIWVVYYINPTFYKTPLAAAALFGGITFVAFLFFYLYKDMAYCKSICPVGTLMRVYSKVSFTKLGTYANSCKNCTTFDCASACAYNLKPFTFDKKHSQEDCTLCMDCASACESINFKLVKPSANLFEQFKTRKVEVWAVLLITAAITITMSFHHALSRVAISDEYFWVKTGVLLENFVGMRGIDYVGISALAYAMICTIGIASLGIWVASKILHVEFSKLFYTLGYAFIPIFIIGGLSHTYEFFFIHHYSNILNGFINGFGIDADIVKPLASRGDAWLKVFGVMNYVGVIWSLVIMAKRVNFFDAPKLSKVVAFSFASSLILFYLYLNVYKVYAFATYGAKKGGHNHGGTKSMFQSVTPDKAVLLQNGKDKASGIVCGMNLAQFYKTNHSAKLDGKVRQYCSIHCLAEDLKLKKLNLTEIQVVDVTTLKFIDAAKAYYVVGSKQTGTMSGTSKYAFEDKKEATKFIKNYGGTIKSFDEALFIALKDFSK
jgi:nitrous oxide reductase accessory protein NosL